MRKKEKIGISVMLTALCLCSAVSCGGEQTLPQNQETVPVSQPEESSASLYDDNGYLYDSLPADLDFGGQTVTVYVRGDRLNEEFVTENSGDIVDDAIFSRNGKIEERLNVKLSFFENTGMDYWGSRNLYLDTVRASVMADDGTIDIAAGLTNMMPFLAEEHLLLNLLDDVSYLDFSAPWWPEQLTEELSVKGRMHFASGEVCLGVVESMMCFYFNKNILKELDLEDPYQLVMDGIWTLDRFETMLSEAYVDLNGNGKTDKEDRFGFTILAEPQAFNFVYSCGSRVTERDADGLPYFCLAEESFINMLSRLAKIMNRDECPVSASTLGNYANAFESGRALFSSGVFSSTENYRDLGFDFGVIPYPKYDEKQERYITTARGDYSCFGIPVTAKIDAAAAVLEALASENYRSVTPAYFEKALKVKYSRDNESAVMFDLIRNSVSYDFGYFYGFMFDDIPQMLRVEILNGKETWASTWESKHTALEKKLSECLDALMSD